MKNIIKMKFFGKFKLTLSLFFLFFTLVYFSYYFYKTSAQTNNIKLYIYPKANYENLGSTTEAGVDSLDTNNLFNKFYNVSPYVTVLDKSFYKLEIPATNNIYITFERLDPSPTRRSINGDCSQLGGSIVGNTCVIYGMITSTALSRNNNYELWKISVSGLSKYFYIVSSSTALNPGNIPDLYYLIPRSTSVTLSDYNPSTTINYSVYYKKLYCPTSTNFPNAESYVSTTPNGFGKFTVGGPDFDNNVYINKLLSINSNVNSGIYLLYLIRERSSNSPIRLSDNATITVTNNITPPTISLSCQAYPKTGLNIGSSTIYTLTASATDILRDSTFTLAILNANNNSSTLIKVFSGYVNYRATSVATSIVWQATGTYYTTGTIEALNRRVATSCPIIFVGECDCLYRVTSDGTVQRRCKRSDGSWGNWEDIDMRREEIPEGCNCHNDEVRNRYHNGCMK